jgi:hypothetical protein
MSLDYPALILDLEQKRDALTHAIETLRGLAGETDPAPVRRRDVQKKWGGARAMPRNRSLPDDARILDQLKHHGEPMSPRDLAKALKMTRPALTFQMKALITSGAVVATGSTMNRQFSLPPARGKRPAKEAP